MPGMDGTGPMSQGPRTGRGLGPCGKGFGQGRRFGRGCPAMQFVGFNQEDEKKILEAELKEIETEKQEIEKRLKEIKK